MGAKDSGRGRGIRAAGSRVVAAGVLSVVGLVGVVGVVALPLVGGGCVNLDAMLRHPDDRPQDFELAVTVYRGERVADDAPLAERDARFVLGADGVLRAEFGRRARAQSFPPVVRRLRPEEVDAVWRRVVGADLRGPSPAGRIPGPEAYEPGAVDEMLIETLAYGRRRTVVRSLEAVPSTAADRELLEDLGGLAWVDGLGVGPAAGSTGGSAGGGR